MALLYSRTVPRIETFFRLLLKLSKVGLFLRQAALFPLREFYRFAEALAKLLDLYLPGYPGGTVRKFNSADLRTLRGTSAQPIHKDTPVPSHTMP